MLPFSVTLDMVLDRAFPKNPRAKSPSPGDRGGCASRIAVVKTIDAGTEPGSCSASATDSSTAGHGPTAFPSPPDRASGCGL